MENYAVLRAAALAGVPAIEVRVAQAAIGEPVGRLAARDEAKAQLAELLLIEELAHAWSTRQRFARGAHRRATGRGDDSRL